MLEEIFIVKNYKIAKWIEIFITKKIGIFANIKFYTIENFFCKVFKKKIFFRDLELFWEILLNQKNNYIKKFFKNKLDEKKKILFSLEIKKIFKKYLLYDPKIILNLKNNSQKSKEKQFQKKLWKSLNNFKKNNFYNCINNYLTKKKTKKRIFIINTNYTSKFFILFLKKLNINFSITILSVTPLGILIKEKNNFKNLNNFDIIKKIKKIIVNPLLMYLAKSSTNLIKSTIKKNINFVKKTRHKKTLLKNIQEDIIFNKLNCKKIHKKDDSILIHSCCSKYKEVEILHKNLIKILNKEKNISFDNIVVISKKIEKYFPYIKSIFKKKKKKNNIPYKIIKNNNNKENESLKFIYKIFSLKEKKITNTEIMYILNTNFIKKKYNIKNEEIKVLEKWISDIFIKFGIKEEIIFKEHKYIGKENTWCYGIKKILLGYITYNKKLIHENDYPYIKINYYNTELVTKLISFINLIKKWKKIFSKPRRLNKWKILLNNIIEEFIFYKNKIKIKLKKLFNKILISGIKIKYKKKICISKLKIIFKKLIKINFFNKNIFFNTVTFCNFNDVENLNFKIIYLLGANYCKKENKKISKTFDLTCENKKDEYYKEKYDYINKILSIIISAEKYFYISYTNNFNKKKYIRVLEILINYISENYYFKKKLIKNFIKNKKNIIKNILKKYKEDISYKCYKICKKNKKKKNIIKTIKIKKEKNINITNIIIFWKNPIEYFLKNTVKLNFFEYYNKDDFDEEPFVLKKYIETIINKKVFEYVLKNKNVKKIFKYYLSLGVFPKKNFGKIIFEKILKNSINLKNKIHNFYNKRYTKKISIKIKKFNIFGNIDITSSKKLILWKPKILNLHDKIEFWFYHLIFCITNKCKYDSKMFGYKNSIIIFKKLNKKKSYNYILKYIKGYFNGISNPIFLTKSGMIWIQNLIKGKNKKKLKKEFIKNWNGNNYIFGEKNNIYIKRIINKNDKKNIKKIYNSSLKWHYPILKNIKK
ncbi:MAG: exodeoxyribonuclease V subunit gamma [Buchnera aphidicola (Ceratovacuna japonica)]